MQILCKRKRVIANPGLCKQAYKPAANEKATLRVAGIGKTESVS